ncbi:MAG: hypothetical protein ABIT71_09565 [Vicinamibacteraceae bacterium]
MSAPTGSAVRAIAAGLLCVAALALPRAAAAQPRLDVTVSGAWWDGYELGQRRASITGPQAPTGAAVTLFDTGVAILPGPGAELRLGWRVFRGVYAEATGGLGVNTIEARITGDIEQAPAITVSSTLTQITIEGGALIELPPLRLSVGNLVPFVDGGAGYLRQVHEQRVLIETGRTFYAGAGVKWRSAVSRPKGLVQRLAVRADARLVSRSDGVDVDDSRRNYITVSAGVGVRLF